ncbi:DUF2065 domain-containing protein [Desulfobulbus elongatus]|uniref:DUF2065 domain-containing protein n=1 Tax=Desulfobulbus elongatus TaxID=53332 RepID=UPI000488DB24|nr:DUF2065 domain-containing protein [Desulfobulbus elongatus]
MKLLITLVGLALVLEGLPYVAFPESMQRWLRQIAALPPHLVRRIGVVAMVVGLLLCALAQKTSIFD